MAYKPPVGVIMAAPNVIPMADIMLVLLIIFMVVTPMLQKGASVDRARVQSPHEMKEADKEDAIIVAVMPDGTIFVGSTRVEKAALTALIKDKLAAKSGDKMVFLNSDRRAHYGDVVAVVDEIRSAGVDQLGLLTEKVGAGKSGALPPPPTGD
jgi:biopolymer transport protein ExbD